MGVAVGRHHSEGRRALTLTYYREQQNAEETSGAHFIWPLGHHLLRRISAYTPPGIWVYSLALFHHLYHRRNIRQATHV